MNIIKGPPRGYAKTIAEKRRQTLPGLPTGLERVVATMAKSELPGCIALTRMSPSTSPTPP